MATVSGSIELDLAPYSFITLRRLVGTVTVMLPAVPKRPAYTFHLDFIKMPLQRHLDLLVSAEGLSQNSQSVPFNMTTILHAKRLHAGGTSVDATGDTPVFDGAPQNILDDETGLVRVNIEYAFHDPDMNEQQVSFGRVLTRAGTTRLVRDTPSESGGLLDIDVVQRVHPAQDWTFAPIDPAKASFPPLDVKLHTLGFGESLPTSLQAFVGDPVEFALGVVDIPQLDRLAWHVS